MVLSARTFFPVLRTTSSRRFVLNRTNRSGGCYPPSVRAQCAAQLDFFRALSSLTEQSILTSYTTGADAYQAYLEALEQAKSAQQDEERVKSQKMFEAWKASEESSSRAPGVKVIKTLAKETRKQHQKSQAQIWTDKAQELLKLAAESYHHPEALVQYANQVMLEFPLTQERLRVAMQYYRKAGEQGVSAGWFNLGHMLWMGVANEEIEVLSPDPNAALQAFENAIELGDADAMYFVGVHCLSAADEDADMTDSSLEAVKDQAIRGLDLIERASKEGHGGALYYLALLNLNGHRALGITPCTPTDFVSLLNAAVDAGYADALFLRGHCHYNGEHGYSQDYSKALKDFLLAADNGNADAAVSAGAMLHKGYPGIARNQEHAFELYQHAGELGSLDGWRNVVACYASGEGVTKSMEMAKYITNTVLKDANVADSHSPSA